MSPQPMSSSRSTSKYELGACILLQRPQLAASGDRAANRANASKSTPIVALRLIWTSEQPYDSPEVRPVPGEWHGCYDSNGFDPKAFSAPQRPAGRGPNTTPADRHPRPGGLRRDCGLP